MVHHSTQSLIAKRCNCATTRAFVNRRDNGHARNGLATVNRFLRPSPSLRTGRVDLEAILIRSAVRLGRSKVRGGQADQLTLQSRGRWDRRDLISSAMARLQSVMAA